MPGWATFVYGLIVAPLWGMSSFIDFWYYQDTVVDKYQFYIIGGPWAYVIICFILSAIQRNSVAMRFIFL